MSQWLQQVKTNALKPWNWTESQIRKQLTRLKLKRRGSFSMSSWTSLVLQPVWKRGFWSPIAGIPLVLAVFAGSTFTPHLDSALTQWSVEQPVSEIMTIEVALPGETHDITYLIPLAQLNGISQYYHPGHNGIDFTAPLGSDVIAFDAGKVTQVEQDYFGYGHHVYVQHERNLISLYAHMSTMSVKVGDTLIAGQKIGEVGLTGRTTGPHLHFELYRGETPVNPIPYLKKSFEMLHKTAQVTNDPNRL